MGNSISVSEVEEFLYCQLFWRFKNQFDLPYCTDSTASLLRSSANRMVSVWFSAISGGKNRKEARESAIRSMLASWGTKEEGSYDYIMAHASTLGVLGTITKDISVDDDLIIGGGVPISIPAGDYRVTDLLAGLLIKNEFNDKAKSVVGINIDVDGMTRVNEKLLPLRRSLIRYTANTALRGRNLPTRHITISVPSFKRTVHSASKKDRQEVLFLVKSVADVIDCGILVPTDSPTKCCSCWYSDICSSYFTRQFPDARVMKKVRNKIEEKVKIYNAENIIGRLQCGN